MKKFIWIITTLVAILIVGGVYYQSTQDNEVEVAGIATVLEEKATLVIDDGVTSQNFDLGIESQETVFDLLKRAALRENLILETKQYDFGISIEAIGDKKGGDNNKYWLYYVNGEMAPVAADQQIVKPGDKVEFRFEESTF